MTALVIIEGVVIVLLAVLVAGLLKSHAEILRQLHALGAGEDGSTRAGATARATGLAEAPATEISGVDPRGAARVVSLANQRGNTLLAFLSTGCASCQTFWKELAEDFDKLTPDTRTVIVTKGPEAESPARVGELAPVDLPLVMSSAAWDEFRVPLTPYFLLIDGESRVVGEGSAQSWMRLLDLFRQSLADSTRPTRLDTAGRAHFTDDQLAGSGIEPGDPSLYENPLEQ